MAQLAQEIIVTVLPNGRDPRRSDLFHVSLHFSPRLTSVGGQETLAHFPDFVNWAEVAAELKVVLVTNTGDEIAIDRLESEDSPNPEIWVQLFPDDTWVRPHAFADLAGFRIRSYGVEHIMARLGNLYGSVLGNSLNEFPAATDLDNGIGDLAPLRNPDHRSRLFKLIDASYGEDGVVQPMGSGSGFSSASQFAFAQAARFYDRPKDPQNLYRERPDPAFVRTPLQVPRLDFHQGVAAVGDFPRLQRQLGLVVDYVFRRPRGFPPKGTLQARLQWPTGQPMAPFHVPRKAPLTHYKAKGDFFGAAPKSGSPLEDGWLDLRQADDNPTTDLTGDFMLNQVDIDGAAIKTTDLAANVAGRDKLSNYRTPKRYSLPTVRTSGISVIRRRRDQALAERLQFSRDANHLFTNDLALSFRADDLLRGYRVDVLDLTEGSNEWRSLCLRKGFYQFVGGSGSLLLELDDEGYVKSASTTGDEQSPDLYLHERLFAFEGWSLVASRPGRVLAADPTDAPSIPDNTPADLPLKTQFRPQAGTLPRLRFGHTYRLRVRAVDLAGNSLPLHDDSQEYASKPLYYARYEPIASPVVLPRTVFGEGESLEHLVIRSDFDRNTAEYASDPDVVAALSAWPHQYAPANDRHLAPPKVSQIEAELHGAFDPFIGAGKSHLKGFHLASREAGTFFSTSILNLNTGSLDPIPDAQLKLFTPPGLTPTDLTTHAPGDPLQQGEYIMRAEAQLTVPYLPDPFARGIALRGLPGDPNDVTLVEFGGTWPDLEPFRIRIVERDETLVGCSSTFADTGIPAWDPAARVLTIFLRKAAISKVRFSCFLSKEDWKQMGMKKWWNGTDAQEAELDEIATTGGHWMITPWRVLTLVHAVQRPLCEPIWTKLQTAKPGIGSTEARLRGHVHENTASTGELDLLARWEEPVDDVLQPAPSKSQHEGHVTQVTVNPDWQNEHPLPAEKTSPRLVHEFGDTKHRMVNYRFKGTTRFREYLPPAINRNDSAISRSGGEFKVSVKSSARPKAPEVVDILPAFGWTETALSNGGITRTREGNALRIYLKRPWYSSGEGELLGVITTNRKIDDALRPYVTQWGKDPVFASSNPSAVQATRFPDRVRVQSSLSLAELGELRRDFTAVGHEVHFDPLRRLWYADIEINAGSSYFPFVRLALARYQPESINNAHLSNVTVAEFSQLVPDRTATLSPTQAGRHNLKILGIAPTKTFLSENPLSIFPDPDGPLDPGKDPVKPFKKPGLNRYEVRAQYLPAGEPHDLGWRDLDGLKIHKPGSVVVAAGIPALAKATTPPTAGEVLSRRVIKASTESLVSPVVRRSGFFSRRRSRRRIPSLKALWEADLTIPEAPGNAPRRLVVEEYEVHPHEADDRNPIKRIAVKRLVYFDVLPL
jgi:hypothetical protein